MSFSAIEKKLLRDIRKVTENFNKEISGYMNLLGRGVYKIEFVGTEKRVPSRPHQSQFHTHPSNNEWQYGGPPSVTDYKFCLTETQMTCYVVGRKYAFRFGESDLEYFQIQKLERSFSLYIKMGEDLENGVLSPEDFSILMLYHFYMTVDVLDLFPPEIDEKSSKN